MRILKIEPNKLMKTIDIEKGLESLQKEVNGRIEIPYINEKLHKNNIDIVLNEEGKLMDLEPSVAVIDKENNETVDLLVGNILFTGFTEEGETVGLTDNQIEIISNVIKVAMYGDNDKELNKVIHLLEI